jgi:hypothetical protein
MKQLARRASLVVVLLLVSVGTASAECAWVLWEKRVAPARITWNVVYAYSKADGHQRCTTDAKKLQDSRAKSPSLPGGRAVHLVLGCTPKVRHGN